MGGRCSRISGGTPEARSRLCVCRAPFLMTFVTSGMSLAGSQQSCPTLSDPMDCSLPGSSLRGISQARILEWVAVSFSCREPARDIPLVTKVMRKEARHTQRRDRASGVPPDILEHLPPKTRVCLLYCFVLSPLTLLGAVPHHHLALSDKELIYSSN